MLPGRFALGSSRRLSPHSTASSSFPLGNFSAGPSCGCLARDSVSALAPAAGRASSGCSPAFPATARTSDGLYFGLPSSCGSSPERFELSHRDASDSSTISHNPCRSRSRSRGFAIPDTKRGIFNPTSSSYGGIGIGGGRASSGAATSCQGFSRGELGAAVAAAVPAAAGAVSCSSAGCMTTEDQDSFARRDACSHGSSSDVANASSHTTDRNRNSRISISINSGNRSRSNLSMASAGGRVAPVAATELTAVAAAASGQRWSSLVEDTTPDNWLSPLRRPGSVVALGKFDALHRGHCALAVAAAALAQEVSTVQTSRAAAADAASDADASTDTAVTTSTAAAATGDAVLLSFSGMAAVLGWPERLPLTAPQDRGRVLAGWATICSSTSNGTCNGGGALRSQQQSARQRATMECAQFLGAVTAPPPPPRLRTLPFSLIRGMSPEQFVALLARDLGAAGVVAGRNYRFGYKAAGDADTLVRLGRQYGMRVEIVDLVTRPDQATATTSGRQLANDASTAAATRTDTSTSISSTAGSNIKTCSSSSVPMLSSVASSPSSNSMMTANDRTVAAVATAASASASSAAASTSPSASASPLSGLSSSAFNGERREGASSSGSDGAGGGQGAAIVALEASSSSCPRVSSSRIRSLLERGRVECVEQLLGRKYRLICDFTRTAAAIMLDHSSSSNGIGVGRKSCVNGSNGRLVVPSVTYQNQPPANGRYWALVQLARGAEVPIHAGSEVGVGGFAASVGDGGGDVRDEGQVSSGACTMVLLSDMGIEVELGEKEIKFLAGVGEGGLLLVDFDACG